jgi:hypothetical protein
MPFTVRPSRRFPVHCAMTYNAGLFPKLPLAYFLGFGLFITLLLLSSGPVYAEWVDVGGKVEEGLTVYTVYVDPDTIRRKGDVVKLWALFDYKTIQAIVGGPWLSSKTQREYDCVEKRVRLLGFTTFSGNMGSGEAVYSNPDESKWEPVAPDSLDRNLWEVACSKQ